MVNQAYLLPLENPDSSISADARHWIAVYTELLAFKEAVMARTTEELGRISEAARSEISQAEMDALESQKEHYRDRLDFWYERHWELVGLRLDDRAESVRSGGVRASLTTREYQLLSFLLNRPGRVFSARELASGAWQDRSLSAEQVRTYVGRLRAHLRALGNPCRIANHSRRGYSLTVST
jgi:DNA-binding response OmpR family regulator